MPLHICRLVESEQSEAKKKYEPFKNEDQCKPAMCALFRPVGNAARGGKLGGSAQDHDSQRIYYSHNYVFNLSECTEANQFFPDLGQPFPGFSVHCRAYQK